MQNLELQDGDNVEFRLVALPKVRKITIQPLRYTFAKINNPKAELESCLVNFPAITQGLSGPFRRWGIWLLFPFLSLSLPCFLPFSSWHYFFFFLGYFFLLSSFVCSPFRHHFLFCLPICFFLDSLFSFLSSFLISLNSSRISFHSSIHSISP